MPAPKITRLKLIYIICKFYGLFNVPYIGISVSYHQLVGALDALFGPSKEPNQLLDPYLEKLSIHNSVIII
jgi:hypothetical protein